MIPRTIHYFWFGNAPKPESVSKCIESWHKFCPDFEIIEWNESNYDVHKQPYIEKAYEEKKWAFVSDYARLDVLYEHGGIYLDTDVEVIRDLSPLCEYSAFIGFENETLVNDGQGFGGEAGFPLFKEMLECYDSDDAYEYWGGEKHYSESPKLRTKVLLRHGVCLNGLRQNVVGMEILPVDYFCPKNYRTGKINITHNTYSIHNFDGSWHEGNYARYASIMHFCCSIFGEKRGFAVYKTILRLKDKMKKILGRK